MLYHWISSTKSARTFLYDWHVPLDHPAFHEVFHILCSRSADLKNSKCFLQRLVSQNVSKHVALMQVDTRWYQIFTGRSHGGVWLRWLDGFDPPVETSPLRWPMVSRRSPTKWQWWRRLPPWGIGPGKLDLFFRSMDRNMAVSRIFKVFPWIYSGSPKLDQKLVGL